MKAGPDRGPTGLIEIALFDRVTFTTWNSNPSGPTAVPAKPRASELPPWVFLSEAGTPLDESNVRKVMTRSLKNARLPLHFTLHCLRHTYASLMLQQGEAVAYIQRQLGHSSIQLTVDTYGKWLPIGNQGAVDRLDSSMSPTGSKMVANQGMDERKFWSWREELNLQPVVYKTTALPLSYASPPCFSHTWR